jgi:ribosome biogenesis GTPase
MDSSRVHLERIGFNALVQRQLVAQGVDLAALLDDSPAAGPLPHGSTDGALPARFVARLIERQRSQSLVHDGTRTLVAKAHPTLRSPEELAVGDWIVCVPDGGSPWIHDRVEPYSLLRRIDPSGARQTLVANVDLALLVMGLDGDFNARRLERYVALAKASGVLPVVVLTKADTCSELDARLDALESRLPRTLERIAVNGTSPDAAAALAPYLSRGTTAVLLGSSGAGKSTLTNTLRGTSIQATGAVREGDDRGRHTTTSRQLVALPSGACVIDTPGLRGLRLDVDEDALDAAFEDIAALAKRCRFRDCSHGDEPGCAVREGVDADRLMNYRKLQREIARDRADPLARQETKAEIKARHRALRAMQKERGR